jgi:hypothetical protein
MATARRQLGYVSSLTTQLVDGAATLDVEFLLVGGGGGGGGSIFGGANRGYGGGGAGGFVTGSGIIGKDTYVVKVGAGGAAGAVNTGNGSQSSFYK